MVLHLMVSPSLMLPWPSLHAPRGARTVWTLRQGCRTCLPHLSAVLNLRLFLEQHA